MKTIKKLTKRITAGLLAALMLLSSPMASLAEEIAVSAVAAETAEAAESYPQVSDGTDGGDSAGEAEDAAELQVEEVMEEPDGSSSEGSVTDEDAAEAEKLGDGQDFHSLLGDGRRNIFVRGVTDKITLQYMLEGEEEWIDVSPEDDSFECGTTAGFTIREIPREDYEAYCRGFLWLRPGTGVQRMYTTPEPDGTYVQHFSSSDIGEGGAIVLFTPQSSLEGQFNISYVSGDGRYQAGYLNGDQFVCWTEDTWAVNYQDGDTIQFRFKENGSPSVPYRVSVDYNDMQTSVAYDSASLAGGVLDYAPTSNAGFTLTVYWTEAEYIYSLLATDQVAEGNYSLEYYVEGKGSVRIANAVRFGDGGGGAYAVELERGKDVVIEATAEEGYTLSAAYLNGRNYAEDAVRTEENPGVATITIPANEIDPDDYPWMEFEFVPNRVHVDNWDRNRISTLDVTSTVNIRKRM